MPLARSLLSTLRGISAPACAAVLSLATAFAGQRQLNEAPPTPEKITAARAPAAAAALNAVPSGFVINPASRETSRLFFRTVYAASENVAIGWTGSVAAGNAGTTSAAFKEAVQRRVNYFRAMSGLPAGITFDATFNTKDQQAALMMSANHALSHAPPTTWMDYTAGGADAAGHSNLFLGSFGPAAITGYIEDFGSPNAEAGHRRWIFYPQTTTMGTGDLPPEGSFDSANALWVATAPGGARPAVRDEFVAWPPPGFVPHSLVFPRWSFSYPGANFASTTVTMRRGGANVPVAIQNRGPGAGEASLVWAWDNLDANLEAAPRPPPAQDTPVQVAVDGVIIGGQSRNFSYTVTLFDPAKAGADTVAAAVSGPAQPAVGASQSYSCNAVPNASGYQFRTAALGALTAIEGAESGTSNVAVEAPAGYAIVSAAYHANGAKSFHLTTPNFNRESITLSRTVLPSATAQLKFKSRLGYATTSQSAHAQVSTDEGNSWDTLFTAAGTGAPAAGFSTETVPLAAYANHTIQVRFIFACEGDGDAFTDTAENVGWYLDDVAFTDAQELTGAKVNAVSAGTTSSFTPAAAGSYALQARGQFFGDYLFEWGPVLAVSAAVNGAPQITTPPADRSAALGGTAQFSVIASGSGTLSYQWFHGTQPISNATGATLHLTGVTASDAGSYRVEVTNSSGTTPSPAATLTVTTPNPVVTTNAGSALSEAAVKLSGHVEVNAQTVACGFEFGATASLGSIAEAGTASGGKDFETTITSLAAHTTIYFRAFAEVGSGARFRGAVKTIATLPPIAALTVTADPAGGGTVAGIPAGPIRVGDALALTAQPASGFGFVGWTGGLARTTATLAFTMPATLTLVAHFSSSPIINAAGRYRGLALTTPATHDSCGLVNLTIAARGAFTGVATIGGAKFALKGGFDAGGVAHFGATTEATLPRAGKAPLLLRLHLPAGNATPAHLLGEVREAAGFTATIDAARVLFTAAKSPAAPLLNPPAAWPGTYTAELALSPATPIADFIGRGWVTATVGKDGTARFVGALADGTRWTSTQALIADGTVPIYASLFAGKGSVFGTVQFAGAPVTLGASAHWYRPALPGPRFAAGWPGGVQLALAGGAWTPVKVGATWLLPGLGAHAGSAQLFTNSGGGSPILDWPTTFSLATGRAVVAPAAAGGSATFVGNPATGIFTGSFKDAAKSVPVGFSGVLLPGIDRARGFFATPTGSGAVSLLPQ